MVKLEGAAKNHPPQRKTKVSITMTTIRQADLIESIAAALQYISY